MLESGDAPNLKTTLKNIIRFAITNAVGNDGYQSFLTDREVTILCSIPCKTHTVLRRNAGAQTSCIRS